MIYPIIVLIIAGGVVALITVFLLPMFVALLKDFGGKEPAAAPQPGPDGVQPVRADDRLVAHPGHR